MVCKCAVTNLPTTKCGCHIRLRYRNGILCCGEYPQYNYIIYPCFVWLESWYSFLIRTRSDRVFVCRLTSIYELFVFITSTPLGLLFYFDPVPWIKPWLLGFSPSGALLFFLSFTMGKTMAIGLQPTLGMPSAPPGLSLHTLTEPRRPACMYIATRFSPPFQKGVSASGGRGI